MKCTWDRHIKLNMSFCWTLIGYFVHLCAYIHVGLYIQVYLSIYHDIRYIMLWNVVGEDQMIQDCVNIKHHCNGVMSTMILAPTWTSAPGVRIALLAVIKENLETVQLVSILEVCGYRYPWMHFLWKIM